MIRKLASLLAVLTIVASFTLVPQPAFAADVLNGINCNSATVSKSAICQDKTTANPVSGKNGLLLKIVRIIAIVAGTTAVIIIILAGFQYLLSAGDATKATNARNSLLYALVGLLVIVLAQSIISFVIKKL